MAIDLINGNSTRYYSTPDDADWTFPTGSDWFFCIWTRVDENSGTSFQYIFSTGNFSATDSSNLFLTESGQGSGNINKWQFNTAAATNLVADTATGGDGKDRLIGIQRVGTELEMWFIEKGQTAVRVANAVRSDTQDGGAPNIGRRVDGSSIRYYGGHVGDVCKGSTSLTEAQWTLLGQGVSPSIVVGADNLDIWFPFREATATVNDLVSGKVATRQGSGILTSEHFPYIGSINPVVPTVGTVTQDIAPTGIASTEAIGTAVLTTGVVDIAANGIPSSESFGTAVLSQATFLSPSGIASEEAIGTAVLTTGAVTLTPDGIISTEAFGTSVITQGAVLSPSGIASEEAIGSATITTGAVVLSPTGIASEEVIGSHTVTVAVAQNLAPSGIASAEAFGSHVVAVTGAKDIQIDFQDEIVIGNNLQSKTLYFNGTNYFTID